MKTMKPLSHFLNEYNERNINNAYKPVAVGRYGIRLREDIYSKELANDYSKNKLIFNNTLTVGMGSVQIDIGVLTEETIYSVSPAYHTYRINGINPSYLRYCLECRNPDMFARFVKRGSRQGKSIDLKRWLTYEIPVYTLEKQQEIVEKIEFLKGLITARTKQIEKINDLVKSQFIEMFGDPRKNEKGWNKATLSDYFKVKGGKRIPKGMGYADGVTSHPYLRATDMKNGTIEDGDIHYIDEEVFKFIKNYTVSSGDIYLTNVGVHLGMAGVIPSRYDGASLTENAVKLIPKKAGIDGKFLSYYINSPGIQEYINERKMTVGVPKLAIFRIETMPLIIPPLEMQKRYSHFVEQTDKSKVLMLNAQKLVIFLIKLCVSIQKIEKVRQKCYNEGSKEAV